MLGLAASWRNIFMVWSPKSSPTGRRVLCETILQASKFCSQLLKPGIFFQEVQFEIWVSSSRAWWRVQISYKCFLLVSRRIEQISIRFLPPALRPIALSEVLSLSPSDRLTEIWSKKFAARRGERLCDFLSPARWELQMNESLFAFLTVENRAYLMGWDISINAEGVKKDRQHLPLSSSINWVHLKLVFEIECCRIRLICIHATWSWSTSWTVCHTDGWFRSLNLKGNELKRAHSS